MGYSAGVQTGGSHPQQLRRALPWLSWIGLDIKAPFERYDVLTGVPGSGARAHESLALALASGVALEVRTTVHALVFDQEQLLRFAKYLADVGVKRYVLQAFQAQGCGDGAFRAHAGARVLDAALVRRIRAMFTDFEVRTAGK